MKDVMVYFGMTTTEFRKEWAQLTTQDKADLKKGIQNGTLNY